MTSSEGNDADNPTDVWYREEAKNHLTSASRLRRESVSVVLATLKREIPEASDFERSEWIGKFREKYPAYFAPSVQNYSKSDIQNLTASEKLALANGEGFPVISTRGVKRNK
jgi:hypothetical protein